MDSSLAWALDDDDDAAAAAVVVVVVVVVAVKGHFEENEGVLWMKRLQAWMDEDV